MFYFLGSSLFTTIHTQFTLQVILWMPLSSIEVVTGKSHRITLSYPQTNK